MNAKGLSSKHVLTFVIGVLDFLLTLDFELCH